MSRLGIGERAPWGDFPPVIRNGDLGALRDEPEYQAAKAGNKQAGQNYLVVDDTLTMGGTIASLRGYVENHGGKVVAALVMTAHEGAVDLAVKAKMLAGIAEKHGPMMNEFWQETFGYGIDKLTQGEAGHLRAAPTVDAIRDRITAARHEGIERLDAARASAPP